MLITADAKHIPLADNNVRLIVTSPPYFGLRNYVDNKSSISSQIGAEDTYEKYIENMLEVTSELKRVLTSDGSIWVNMGDKYNAYNGNRGEGTLQNNISRQNVPTGSGLDAKNIPNKSLIGLPYRYALACIDQLGLTLRAEVIWSKQGGLPESVKDRVRRNHETWFHFTKNSRYYANTENLKKMAEGGYKMPGSVQEVPLQPLRVPKNLGVKHYASFPLQWPLWIVNGWSEKEDVVLDPFCGTGTTVLAANVLGRAGFGMDLSQDYLKVASWRLKDSKEIEKAKQLKETLFKK